MPVKRSKLITAQEAKKLVRRLQDKLQQEHIPVHEVMIFGSIAKGDQHRWSDIDVAIICDPFLPTRHEENMVIRKLRRDIDLRISPMCIHPVDFEAPYWRLPREIRSHGIPVR